MDLTLIIPAFISGLLTFLAPCTLPLVPGYLAFIAGASVKDLQDSGKATLIRKRIFVNGLMYVLGFSLVFILMGSVFGAAGSFLSKYRLWLSRIGGAFVIFFGLYLMNVFNWPLFKNFFSFLNKTGKISIAHKLTPGKPGSSFIFGATFAFGWTPCIGPILGTILVLASTTGTAFQGSILLLVFSLGLAVPFLVIALGFGQAAAYVKKITKYLKVISFIGGLFLLFIGILLLTDNLVIWVGYFYQWFSFINYESILDYL